MRNQLDNLEEAGMKFDQVVSTTVYLDSFRRPPISKTFTTNISAARYRRRPRCSKFPPPLNALRTPKVITQTSNKCP